MNTEKGRSLTINSSLSPYCKVMKWDDFVGIFLKEIMYTVRFTVDIGKTQAKIWKEGGWLLGIRQILLKGFSRAVVEQKGGKIKIDDTITANGKKTISKSILKWYLTSVYVFSLSSIFLLLTIFILPSAKEEGIKSFSIGCRGMEKRRRREKGR